jgi:hypothetical protein
MVNLRKGARFLHTKWLDADYSGKPAMFEVTRITKSAIYYRPVYDAGLPSERLGSGCYTIPEKFESYAVKEWIS